MNCYVVEYWSLSLVIAGSKKYYETQVDCSNYNKKIEGVYNWIAGINNILFVPNISNREKLSADIKTIISVKSNNKQVLYNLQKQYQNLRNHIIL